MAFRLIKGKTLEASYSKTRCFYVLFQAVKELRCIATTNGAGTIRLKPFVDAFGVIFVAARQNAKRLTSFEFAHANDASALATFFDLAGKSIRR